MYGEYQQSLMFQVQLKNNLIVNEELNCWYFKAPEHSCHSTALLCYGRACHVFVVFVKHSYWVCIAQPSCAHSKSLHFFYFPQICSSQHENLPVVRDAPTLTYLINVNTFLFFINIPSEDSLTIFSCECFAYMYICAPGVCPRRTEEGLETPRIRLTDTESSYSLQVQVLLSSPEHTF